MRLPRTMEIVSTTRSCIIRGNMAKLWTELRTTDFTISDPEWPPSRPSAEVEVNGMLVELAISKRVAVTEPMVSLFTGALRSWNSAAFEVASRTQDFLQISLPGRTIHPPDLLLWHVKLFLSDSENRNPDVIRFSFNIDGDYENESSDFTKDSVIEMSVKIHNGEIDMTRLSFDVIHDF